mmetsp:Transcript_63026/g.180670  ORF Transcript_63026/g.180670 Transcript_63026/m.180670 type:complete len:229 (-) Transcript_63026:422-1108(-)
MRGGLADGGEGAGRVRQQLGIGCSWRLGEAGLRALRLWYRHIARGTRRVGGAATLLGAVALGLRPRLRGLRRRPRGGRSQVALAGGCCAGFVCALPRVRRLRQRHGRGGRRHRRGGLLRGSGRLRDGGGGPRRARGGLQGDAEARRGLGLHPPSRPGSDARGVGASAAGGSGRTGAALPGGLRPRRGLDEGGHLGLRRTGGFGRGLCRFPRFQSERGPLQASERARAT